MISAQFYKTQLHLSILSLLVMVMVALRQFRVAGHSMRSSDIAGEQEGPTLRAFVWVRSIRRLPYLWTRARLSRERFADYCFASWEPAICSTPEKGSPTLSTSTSISGASRRTRRTSAATPGAAIAPPSSRWASSTSTGSSWRTKAKCSTTGSRTTAFAESAAFPWAASTLTLSFLVMMIKTAYTYGTWFPDKSSSFTCYYAPDRFVSNQVISRKNATAENILILIE
uniref:Putative secreted protein n=1 Tax=Amblyomma americanum TaxID=6943 RepID=A0A0C9RY29_AMBAM